MSLTLDEKMVQALPPDGSDESLCHGVGFRGPEWGLDDPDALRSKDLVERARELGVSVADQEPDALKLTACRQVPGLLG